MNSTPRQNDTENIGWKFPPTGGGVQDGYNHQGMAHFTGNRLHHLAREILQNSLDARKQTNEPVSVTFEVKTFEQDQVPGIKELITHIDVCIEECGRNDQSTAKQELELAKSILTRKQVTFLKVYDSNTTGLQDNWDALLKGAGTSVKAHNTAGGSHGIGKNAAFVISPARTVFYWSAHEVPDSLDSVSEKFQGKSILMSHTIDEEELQGTGYWGVQKHCKELNSEINQIPHQFRILSPQHKPVQGTAIWIAGFKMESNWQNQIANHVIENFFYAIDKHLLNVILEPSNGADDNELFEINANTLDAWLNKLEKISSNSESKANYTRTYLKFIRDSSSAKEFEDDDLGTCRFWIELDENHPRHVALVRNTGMLITTDQAGLKKFYNVQNFIALCYFESSEGNKLLREMENTKHDEFSADFLSEDQREKGRKILKRLVEEIRKLVNNSAKRNIEQESEQLTELSRYLPLTHSEGPLGLDADGEKAFGKYGEITTNKIKLKIYPSPVIDLSDDENDDSNNSEDTEPNGPGGNSGGGKSNNGNSKNWRNFEIEDVRVLPHQSAEGVYFVSFVPSNTATIKLNFRIAGDQHSKVRQNIQAASFSESGELILSPLTTQEVVGNKRFTTLIYDAKPNQNSAWIVYAFKADAET